MLKKYLSKFTVDVLPSVFATVVGAYIVNYYIIPKAREDRPPAPAAAVSAKPPETSQAKPADAKPAETAAEVVDAPEPVPAPAKKPVEKASTEKSDKSEAAKSEAAKSEAPKAAEARRHAPREKTVAKAEPPAVAAPATPVLATVGTAAPVGDANGLARAAIERLSRGEKAEAPRVPEAPRTASIQPQPAPAAQPTLQQAQPSVQQAQPMQQLPPPIVVLNPNVENLQPAERVEQSRGPRPPSDVPVPLRGDMQANADGGGRTNVVEDVLSGARSMFDRVIPRPFER